MGGPSRRKSIPTTTASPGYLSKSNLQKVVYGILALATIYGIVMTITNWWVCDDAFISFRYAKNLVNGQGFVFNIGEKVEGYSNFLWTLLAAGGMKLGLDPVSLTTILGILSYLAVVAALALISWRIFEHESTGRFFLPVTAILLLLHHDMHVFANSGLETMFTTALVMFGFLFLVTGKEPGDFLLAGFILTLAALARPDGLLFTGLGGLFVLGMERRVKPVLFYVLPVLLIYLPYFLWRYQYYGFLFPNTYYAKSGDLSYWSQGWVYLWVYLKTYYLLLLVPPATGLFFVLWTQKTFNKNPLVMRATLLALLFCVPYTLYIVKVGGDFMFARFWIVVTPLLVLLIEIAVRLVFSKRETALLFTIILGGTVLFRADLYADDPKSQISGIANEPAYYPPTHFEMARTEGEKLKRFLSGLNATLAFRGQHAMQIYYSDVPVAIEAATGLTDSYIAHMPLTQRGRPGHEKTAPLDYLNSRGVEFMLVGVAPPRNLVDSLTQISFDGQLVRILQYNGAVMDGLKRFPEVKFVDMPKFLDDWIPQIPYMDKEVAKRSWDFFEGYYFKPTKDPVRQSAFLAELAKSAGQ